MKLRNGKIISIQNKSTMTFKKWLSQVDKLILIKTFINRDDLPDENYWIHWDEGLSVGEMVDMIMANNNYFF